MVTGVPIPLMDRRRRPERMPLQGIPFLVLDVICQLIGFTNEALCWQRPPHGEV